MFANGIRSIYLDRLRNKERGKNPFVVFSKSLGDIWLITAKELLLQRFCAFSKSGVLTHSDSQVVGVLKSKFNIRLHQKTFINGSLFPLRVSDHLKISLLWLCEISRYGLVMTLGYKPFYRFNTQTIAITMPWSQAVILSDHVSKYERQNTD